MANLNRRFGRSASVLLVVGSLVSVAGCARFFPSDGGNPQLALIRVGDQLQIRLPDCAAGASQSIRILDNDPVTNPSGELKAYWEVDRPWPAGQTSIVIGENAPGTKVKVPFESLATHPLISVDVTGGKQTWEGSFDLRRVTTKLNGGVDLARPIGRQQLNQIGGCPE